MRMVNEPFSILLSENYRDASGDCAGAAAGIKSEAAVSRDPRACARDNNVRVDQSEGSAARLGPVAFDMGPDFSRFAAFFVGARAIDKSVLGEASEIAVCIAIAACRGKLLEEGEDRLRGILHAFQSDAASLCCQAARVIVLRGSCSDTDLCMNGWFTVEWRRREPETRGLFSPSATSRR